MSLESLVVKLYEIEAVKFGNFTLKSGIQSPVYFDLRVIVSYPDVMVEVSEHLWKAVEASKTEFASVCGVPYTALPIATCMSTAHNVPMLIRRKEMKDYGTKKMIEGHFKKGDVCLIVEDVVTSGTSVSETVQTLNNEGIKVKDAVVLLNREQGGEQRLASEGVTLHSVCKISQVLDILEKAKKLDRDTVQRVQDFIASNNTFGNNIKRPADGMGDAQQKKVKKVLTYPERQSQCKHEVLKRLYGIMEEKKTNLCFSGDTTSFAELLEVVEKVGPYICILKTHIDIITDFTAENIHKLKNLASKHNFLLFEDRKFADIGNTVKKQYSEGIYKISEWSDIINAHIIPGPGIIEGLKSAAGEKGLTGKRALLLIAEMSSKGNVATGEYTKACVKMAEENQDFVVGYICQSQLSKDPNFIHMTPGVKLVEGTDSLGQQYLTPKEVITKRNSDIIIVGRGIMNSDDPATTAATYQQAGYDAYLEQCS
ncbi:unnamed protein product [Owenia fusiformis]|uniref:Uridine 5'-monophosphate synthase n=1 Tax=Owenia fusiformis TaxID=6347 RepID=A0A8S4P022_OWEFU|nr:unnamed protein product [Owenia fusiformis]